VSRLDYAAIFDALQRMKSPPLPAKVRRFDIEGRPVRLVEADDGKRSWLCDCPKFKERATRQAEGFCAHTAVAIWRCIEDGSIKIRRRRPPRARL